MQFAGFTCGHLPAINNYRVDASLVPTLLRACSPTTVSRLVVAVVIYAIDGHAFRPWSHVGKEVFEL